MDQIIDSKAVQVLREAQRGADEVARLAIREAAHLIELSSQLEQKVRELTALSAAGSR
jgi:hypothetical protein